VVQVRDAEAWQLVDERLDEMRRLSYAELREWVQATMGVEAAQRDLEDIAPPLSAQGEEIEEPGEEADRLTIGREEAREVDERGEERLTRGGADPSVTSGTDEPHQPSEGR
jgi:hypothetical protein